jgi:hypothetical protein
MHIATTCVDICTVVHGKGRRQLFYCQAVAHVVLYTDIERTMKPGTPRDMRRDT